MKPPTVAELSTLDVSLEEQGYDVPVSVSRNVVVAALAELSIDLARGRTWLGQRMVELVDTLQGQVGVDDVRLVRGPPIEPLTADDWQRIHDVGGGYVPLTPAD